MIYINEEEIGLGKSKFLKKIQIKKIAKPVGKALKKVSIKNVVKVAKFAAPIAAGFIPVGGGVASKLLNSKVGKVVSKVAKSKVAKKAVKLSKTKVGALVVNKAKVIARPKIEAIKAIGGATFAKTEAQSPQASTPYSNEDSGDNTEPVGELTPVKQTSTVAKVVSKTATNYSNEDSGDNAEPVGELTPVRQNSSYANEMQNIKVDDADVKTAAKKDNTILYVGGAVALAGIAFLATKKK